MDKDLTAEQKHILLEEGTEVSGSSPLNYEKREGDYLCAGCGTKLFESSKKYESGSGWPSFFESLPGVFETKVDKIADYPMIFNVVISKEIASLLELDPDNPYVEIIELKKNKKFVAKKSNTFDEEKNVAEKAPVQEIEIDDLSKNESNSERNKSKIIKKNFFLVVGDFYYEESALNLKNELISKIELKDISIKKVKQNQYRLFVGPFKNFNTLKVAYISLNKIGFDDLNIIRE